MSSRLDAARLETGPAGTPNFRPAIHFTARDTWLNDPNGLVFYDGLYHLFYQNNPYGNVWGNMSWGHATSIDLLHWTEHPVAIACDDVEDVFSGSVVVDHGNTSGFGTADAPALVAIYTSAFKKGSEHDGTQAQSLAYSSDGGMTWSKYAANPVLTRGTPHFRDPKVFRYEGPDGAWWVMVAVEAQQQQVLLYRSADLKTWEFLSDFGPANARAAEWECPDLFPLVVDEDPGNVKWVLIVNINPGSVAGGSGAQYFIGDFDGTAFTPDPSSLVDMPSGVDGAAYKQALRECSWLDWGRDYYAAVSFSNVPDNRRIMIGWMNNWDYANELPTHPWRSGMSLAREVRLETIDGRPCLVQDPILPAPIPTKEPTYPVTAGAGQAVELDDSVLRLPAAVPGTAQIIDAEILPGTAQRVRFRLLGSPDGTKATVLSYDTITGELRLDRRNSGNTGFHGKFASVESAPVDLENGGLKLLIVVDHCSVEVFAQGGKVVLTDLIFPETGNQENWLSAEGGPATILKLAVSTLT
jgi:levanase/levanbiose-producing levanase